MKLEETLDISSIIFTDEQAEVFSWLIHSTFIKHSKCHTLYEVMEFNDGSLPHLPETSRDLDKQSNNLFLTGAIIGVILPSVRGV